MPEIVNHTHCNCGAVTLFFDNGEHNSIKRSHMKAHGITLRGSKNIGHYYNCNHCVNHYGLDICECGSGKVLEKCCKGGARETLGESVESSVASIQRKGGFAA